MALTDPSVPSHGRDIHPDHFLVLMTAADRLVGGLTVMAEEAFRDAVRAAYRIGYAAALGCPIEVNENGDGLVIGDRPDPAEPPTAHARSVDGLLANVRLALATATSDDERTEAVEMLLSGWYAAWPDTAVTDPHWPLAGELVRLLGSSRAVRVQRLQGPLAGYTVVAETSAVPSEHDVRCLDDPPPVAASPS